MVSTLNSSAVQTIFKGLLKARLAFLGITERITGIRYEGNEVVITTN